MHKPQAHSLGPKGVRRKEKNDCQEKYFVVKRSTLEGCIRTVTLLIGGDLD